MSALTARDSGGRPADLLWLESPTNPLIDVADLTALCRAGREAGALVVVDNTFATPLGQQPLALGADLVLHSATKFIGGHSDLLTGIAVAASEELAARLVRRRQLAGATPGALEAFLALRGLRTLPVRLARAQESAGVLAARLLDHPAVERVRYPGLADDPGHALAARQMNGFGAMLSFEVRGGAAAADAVCRALRVVTNATSLGGVESTIERRAKLAGQEHIPPGLLRFSVGVEHVEDLWDDLSAALTAGDVAADAERSARRDPARSADDVLDRAAELRRRRRRPHRCASSAASAASAGGFAASAAGGGSCLADPRKTTT